MGAVGLANYHYLASHNGEFEPAGFDGKTPVLSGDKMRQLVDSIDTSEG